MLKKPKLQITVTLSWQILLKLGIFLDKKETFDLVLDWATLHCLPFSTIPFYTKQITNHTHSGSYFLLRVFNHPDPKGRYFIEKLNNLKSRIYFYQLKKIKKLFSHFSLVAFNYSLPRTKTHYRFLEVLLQKK